MTNREKYQAHLESCDGCNLSLSGLLTAEEPAITVEAIPKSLNIGCTFCGAQAIQIVAHVENKITEVISTACRQCAEEACW